MTTSSKYLSISKAQVMILVFCLFTGASTQAADPTAPSATQLQSITQRGRELAAYEEAVVRSTDAIMRLKKVIPSILDTNFKMYLARTVGDR